MKLLDTLSLWVKNVVSRWQLNRYQNKFLDAVQFISHKAKPEERSLLLALFNQDELDKRNAELWLMGLLNTYKKELTNDI